MNFTEEDRKKISNIDLIKKIIVIMNLIFEKDNIDIDSLFEYVLSDDCADAENSNKELFYEYTTYINSLLSLLSDTDVLSSIEFNIKHICGSYLCDGITGLESIPDIVGFSSFFSDFLIATIKNQSLFEKKDLTLEDLIQNFTFKDINWNINKKYHNSDNESLVLDRNNYARKELTDMLSYYKKNGNYV